MSIARPLWDAVSVTEALVITAATIYIALYLRISKDKTGKIEGVGRQERAGRAYAERMWPGIPVRVFKDNNLSAYDDNTVRKGYDDLRAAVKAKEVAHIWTVEQTRLEANKKRWVELVADLDDAGITEIHTDRDGIVRLDEVADIKHILSWHERRRVRERVHDTLDDLATEGRPGPAKHIAYEHVEVDGVKTLKIIPKYAEVTRWAARSALKGWSLTAIMRELERRKVPTVNGGQWRQQSVKGMLTAPIVAGYRVHQGKIVRKGNWEPVLDEATWRRLCVLFDAPREVTLSNGVKRTVGSRPRAPRSYLLSGTLHCDKCKHHLVGGLRTTKSTGKQWRNYVCVTSVGGCGCTAIIAEKTDEEVVRRVLKRLDQPDVHAAMIEDAHAARRDELVAELADIEAQHVGLAKRWGAKQLPDAAWDVARAELDLRKLEASTELADMPAPTVDFDVASLRADWEEMTLEEQRHVVRLVLKKATIVEAKPGTNRFDPSRVVIDDDDWLI